MTALEPTDKRSGNSVKWKCRCDCGNVCEISAKSLRSGATQSCGCLSKEIHSSDISGQKFGRLTALEPTDKKLRGYVVWKCKCDCGNICEVLSTELQRGRKQSCGCIKKEKSDITGQKFGKLTALEPTDKRNNGSIVWKCKCDCGNFCEATLNALKVGHKQSCGCLHKSIAAGQKFGNLTALEPIRTDGKIKWKCQCGCGNICYVLPASLQNGSTQGCGCLNRVDLTGQRFGKLTALEPTDKRKNGNIVWKCKCDCGNICEYTTGSLRSGTKSCGCASLGINMIDLTGKRFGRLVVLESVRRDGKLKWRCKCDCGKICETSESLLISGRTQSCGCYGKEAREKHHDDVCVENTQLDNLSSKTTKANTSGRRGVSWSNKDRKWFAYINFQKKRISLGYYDKFEDAVKARELGEEQYFEPMLEKYGKKLE